MWSKITTATEVRRLTPAAEDRVGEREVENA